MTGSSRAHLVDLFEAVKYDIRLHGFRFITLEFELVGIGAAALAGLELLHAPSGQMPLLGGIWFLGVALNCLAIVLLARQAQRLGAGTALGPRRVQWYALQLVVLLLVPPAVAIVALYQWRAGDFPATSTEQEHV
jgi:hypothetical protein